MLNSRSAGNEICVEDLLCDKFSPALQTIASFISTNSSHAENLSNVKLYYAQERSLNFLFWYEVKLNSLTGSLSIEQPAHQVNVLPLVSPPKQTSKELPGKRRHLNVSIRGTIRRLNASPSLGSLIWIIFFLTRTRKE
jgi:hypothetical protein